MTKRKAPPWKISAWRKHVRVAEFEIPAHKLGSTDIKVFLRALVVRLRTETLEDMIPYYVNGRDGEPSQLHFTDIIRDFSDDQTEQGYFCGNWECYARARQSIGSDQAAAIREIINRTKTAQ